MLLSALIAGGHDCAVITGINQLHFQFTLIEKLHQMHMFVHVFGSNGWNSSIFLIRILCFQRLSKTRNRGQCLVLCYIKPDSNLPFASV